MVMLNGTSIPHSVLNNNGGLAVFSHTHTQTTHTHTHTHTHYDCSAVPCQQTVESVWRREWERRERERERERANTRTCGGNAAVGWLHPFGAFSVKPDRSLGLDLVAWLSQGYSGLGRSGRTGCWSGRDPFLCHPLLQQPALALYHTPLLLDAGADPALSVSQRERGGGGVENEREEEENLKGSSHEE